MPEVVDAEIVGADEDLDRGFVAIPPAVVQEAIAGNTLLEIKNSLDAVWLHDDESELPQDQSLCATHVIAVHFLEKALKDLGDFSPQAYTPSVRGWMVVAQKALMDLHAMGTPKHTNHGDLFKIAEIVTEFLGNGHKMLNQNTKQRDRKAMAGQLLAEMVTMNVEGDKETKSHATE